MKKTLFAALIAVCMMIGTSAVAQQMNQNSKPKEKATPEQVAQRQTERMTQSLTLTEAQAKQIYALNLENAKAQQAQQDRMTAMRKAKVEKMKGILTEEQFAKWQEMRKARRHENRRDGMRSAECPKIQNCPQAPCNRKNKK
ncbi:MAG: DUF4890 domain-containing protein [Alistipes sp.]